MSPAKRSGKSSPAPASEVLDEAEQQRQIDEIRATATRQAENGRKFGYWLLLVVAMLLSSCFVYNTLFPFEMAHMKHWGGLVPHWAFQLYYLLSCLVMVFAALVTKRGFFSLPLVLRVAGCATSVLLLAAWTTAFVTNPPPFETHWTLLWLPLAPPFAVLVGIYVDRDAQSLLREVDILDELRYPHKSA